MAEPEAALPAAAETVLTFLESVGRRSEAELYLRLFRKLPKQSFAFIVVGKAVVHHALGSLVEQLRFLSQLGLYAPVVLGMFEPQSAGTNAERLAKRLPSAGIEPRVHAFSEPDLPARLAEELTSERVPVLHFEAAPSAGVAERLARVGELVRALDSRKLVVLRRSGGIGGELCQPGRLGLELGPGHVLQLRTGGISTVNLRTDYEALMLPRRLRKEDADLLCLIANFFDAQPPARLLVSVASPLRLLEELFTVKGAGTLIKPGSTIDRHASYATLDVAALRALLEASFQRKLVANFFDAEPSAVYVERGYRGAAIVQAGGTAAFLSKFAVEPEAQGEGIGQDLWQSLSLDFPALFWRARPGNPIAAWYAGLADGLMRLPAWHVFWRGVPAAAVPALIEEAMARSVDFEA